MGQRKQTLLFSGNARFSWIGPRRWGLFYVFLGNLKGEHHSSGKAFDPSDFSMELLTVRYRPRTKKTPGKSLWAKVGGSCARYLSALRCYSIYQCHNAAFITLGPYQIHFFSLLYSTEKRFAIAQNNRINGQSHFIDQVEVEKGRYQFCPAIKP